MADSMVTADGLIWIILAVTAAVCVVSMLGVFASVMRHETQLHDLRNRVASLQYSYTLQLARLHGHIDPADEEPGEVDVLEDDGAPAGAGLEVGLEAGPAVGEAGGAPASRAA